MKPIAIDYSEIAKPLMVQLEEQGIMVMDNVLIEKFQTILFNVWQLKEYNLVTDNESREITNRLHKQLVACITNS